MMIIITTTIIIIIIRITDASLNAANSQYAVHVSDSVRMELKMRFVPLRWFTLQ
jgi:hypothetical protein